MKTILTLLIGLFLTVTLMAKSVQADFQYVTFYSPETGPYVEVYISVNGSSVFFQKLENGKFQGSVNYTVMFKQDDKVIDFAKNCILSPIVDDTTDVDFNFVDIKRFQLPNGEYKMHFSIADAAKPEIEYSGNETLLLNYNRNEIAVSGIELVDSYSKSSTVTVLTKQGYDIVPKIFAFYPEEENKLTFYTEIYNSDMAIGADSAYLVTYYLQNYESHKKLKNFTFHLREKGKEVNVLLRSMDISKLPNGNYLLIVEARNRKNKLIGMNTIFFMRSNPSIEYSTESLADINTSKSFVSKIITRDSLEFCVQCLRPIAGNLDKSFIDHQMVNQSDDVLRKFIYGFWEDRDIANPQAAWMNYYKQVLDVEKAYSMQRIHGFATDRGRVYLQYGPPNTVVDRSFDSSSPETVEGGVVPYEIWHYYQLNNQRDRKFVFYSPHLVGNDYDLIHSNAQGESYNPQWQTMLKRNTFNDVNTGDNGFDGQSGEYYNNPY